MALETLQKVQFKINLVDSTDPEGNVKTVAVSFAKLNPTSFDVDKAMLIAAKISPCLEKTTHSKVIVKTSAVEDE